MKKKTDGTKNYYKELTGQESRSERIKKEATLIKTAGLSEDQLVKLSDDLRQPIADSASATNPMQ